MLKVGDKAPDFNLPTDGGTKLHLKDLLGKQVVIFFFPRANTPG